MKLNWFSPLLPARTDIAHYTARILPALSEQAEVTLWTDQLEWDGTLERYAQVRRYDPRAVSWPEINYRDASFYNIGNNPLFHGSIWEVSRHAPGIVILHDLKLHHFFDGLYRTAERDLFGYMREMWRLYGERGRESAVESFMNEATAIDEMAESYPLTPLALSGALGVIVHTEAAYQELRLDERLEVAYAPLPYPARSIAQTRQPKAHHASGPAGREPYRLIVFGYLGRNRRLDALLEALSRFPDKERFHLDIYGQVEESGRLRGMIGDSSLDGLVSVHGFVEEEELDRALSASDLVINLRYPTMGEASGSVLRAWAHGLPSLVTRVGWYATLSEQAVAHVRPQHEVADIQQHLSAFLQNPERFVMMGERGRRILEEQHTPEGYVKTLIDLASQARGLRERAVRYQLSERTGTLMSGWLNSSSASDELLRRVSEAINALA